MKRILFELLLFILTIGSSTMSIAQTIVPIIDSNSTLIDISGQINNTEIHLPIVKNRPEFSAGKLAWQDFLRNNINIRVPFSNKAITGSYNVMIRFIVGPDGKLKDIGADTNCGYGMEAEVIRCMQKSPDWIPATTGSGRKVNFTLRQVVIFIVKKNNIEIRFN